MAQSCVSPDNFVAVALVINRSRDGPAFVFHYPPFIQPPQDEVEDRHDAADDLNDVLLERLSQPVSRDAAKTASALSWNRDDHFTTDSGSQVVPWEHVAGFPARDLAGILTPARAYHKSLFQLSLDPLHCISYPIHVPQDGKWKKTKKKKKDKACAKSVASSNKPTSAAPDEELAPDETDKPNGKHADLSDERNTAAEEAEEERDDKEEKRSSMTMFNLVFFLRPSIGEVKDLVETLYTNIVKKANKAFKYSQQHSDFIWKESKKILSAKEKAREDQKRMSVLWKEILQTSSLAASMHDIYEAISQNKIAALHLETAAGVLTPSFQIPVPDYIPDLPEANDRAQRGLWLTTSNAFMSHDALDEPGALNRNFALLLMEDEHKIITELQADPDPTTVSMVEFVRLSKPTMSFNQLAQSNILTLSQVRKFAQHFIYWRRAMAIPPLHARDVYIVSPNANTSRLPRDSHDWQREFPLAPHLANFLGELSQCPRPYKHFCPSKAHRPIYLLMLAWLLRRGWVTQLCTFAYILVWPEIIYEVEHAMEAEEIAAAARAEQAGPSASDQQGPSSPMSSSLADSQTLSLHESLDLSAPSSPTAGPFTTTEHAAEMARLERVAQKAHREATERVVSHSRKAPPVATVHPAINDAPHLRSLAPHIILDAKKATGKESRYLSAIAQRFGDDKMQRAWGRMCRYFDGRTALERIALQEDMKRKEVWDMLTSMTEYLLCVRHW